MYDTDKSLLTMLQYIIHQYDFNLLFAQHLVADLSEDQMTIIPGPGLVNHPAFTLGHLVSGSALMAEDLGGTFSMPEGWKELFLRRGPGDPTMPDDDAALYPPKQQLLDELQRKHELVKQLMQEATPQKLQDPVDWRFGRYMPTMYDLLVFMCISHESMHLGQLSAWRRAMDLPSALGAIRR